MSARLQRTRRRLFLLLFVTSTATALSQQPAVSFIPSFTLEISDEQPLSARLPSPMTEGTIGCLADGSLVVHSFLDKPASAAQDPSTPMTLSVISPDGGVKGFDVAQIHDLKKVEDNLTYDVGTNEVVLLVSTYSGAHWTPATESKWLAHFDRQGTYKGSTQLNLNHLALSHIAVFDNGDSLLFGMDEINRLPELALYSEGDQKLIPYQPDVPFAKSNPSAPSVLAPDSARKGHSDVEDYYKVQSAIDLSQFVHFKDSILLLQRNVGQQIYQLFPNGSMNTIKLPTEDGFTADSLIGSDEGVYVRYQRRGTKTGRGDDAYILEISPFTGSALRKIRIADATIWDVACVHNNTFRITSMKSEHAFEFFTATARAGH